MNEALATTDNNEALEKAILHGDLAKLSRDERVQHYNAVCDSLGLNKLTQPFAYIELQGKLRLYALRSCTEQLRKIHNVSITLHPTEQIGDVYVVRATATMPNGRTDEDMGAVPIKGLQGEKLANALMKTTTKAKRRATLGICGLAFLDESELDTVPAKTHTVGEIHVNDPAGTKELTPNAPKARMDDQGEVVPRPDGGIPDFKVGACEGFRMDDYRNVPPEYLGKLARASLAELVDMFGQDEAQGLQAWARWLTAKVAT